MLLTKAARADRCDDLAKELKNGIDGIRTAAGAPADLRRRCAGKPAENITSPWRHLGDPARREKPP
ncbi:hypothetical protein ACQR16_33120 [Bradyrhizobium oligotrophicum]|uniref:hypothetical protein n=1 Tax=Bradyrhizobium oligotrophicum TaxID=44255 RepID=UPI003EBFE1DB